MDLWLCVDLTLLSTCIHYSWTFPHVPAAAPTDLHERRKRSAHRMGLGSLIAVAVHIWACNTNVTAPPPWFTAPALPPRANAETLVRVAIFAILDTQKTLLSSDFALSFLNHFQRGRQNLLSPGLMAWGALARPSCCALRLNLGRAPVLAGLSQCHLSRLS